MKNLTKKGQQQRWLCELPNASILSKRIILLLVLCFALTSGAYAQRCLPGMRGIQLTGGLTDGLYASSTKSESGYYFGVSMATYAGNFNKWVFGAEYLKRYYPYKSTRVPIEQLTAEGGYFINFLSDWSRTFFCSLGASALAGYEIVNRGERLLFDGATLEGRDEFLYGGAMTLEMETYLSDRVVLLLTGRQRLLFGSQVAKFHTQFGVGFRFMIQ